jgi:hypothetical protein
MNDKTNDEKLRILQERLAQIKQKNETPVPPRQQREEVIEVSTPEVPTKEKKPLDLSWVKKAVIVGSVAFGIFYGYTNIDFNSLVPDFSSEGIAEENTSTQLEYNFEIEGGQLAIIRSFEEEGSAKAMVNDLKIKGFKCDYFFLPNKSNNTEQVYKVFIGPYENEEESNQWIENLDLEVTLINVKDGTILKKVKSTRFKEEELKKEKLAKEKEKQKIEKEAKLDEERKRLEEEKEKEAKLDEERKKQQKIEREKQSKSEAEEKKRKEDLSIAKEKSDLKRENTKLKEQIAKLSKEKEKELKELKVLNKKITITYSYEFTDITEGRGQLVITNNAGFPIIKQNYSNIQTQGGPEKLIAKVKYELDNYGMSLDGVDFEKSNTLVQVYNGTIKVLFW